MRIYNRNGLMNITRIFLMFLLIIASGDFLKIGYTQQSKKTKKPVKLLEIEIKKGDTLHSFAERYLDDPSRWPELLEYNKIPSGNPNLIVPGDKLKVPVEMVKDEIADIVYMKNNVRLRRKKANIWEGAELYERLYPEDGIRTARSSFAQIKYLVGGMANISENSLVFLRPEKKRDNVIRLEIGELRAKDVKVLTATAVIDPEKGSEYMARVDEQKTTTLTVFKGKVDFISKGEIVTVNEGYMSVAKLNMPPMEPMRMPDPPKFKKEKKMEKGVKKDEAITREVAAKRILSKGIVDIELLMGSIDFTEERKESSRTYIKKIHIQLARDKGFSRVVLDRKVDNANPEYWKENLVDGTYWWHAAFIDNHGVQGKYSDAIELVVRNRPPKIEVTSPIDGEKINKKIVTVSGKTEQDVFLKINDNRAIVYEDGSFISAVILKPGPNKIIVKAIDYHQRVTIKTITVIGLIKEESSEFEAGDKPLTIKIRRPRDGGKIRKEIVILKGETNPGASVTVNDKQVIVERDGGFVTGISIKFGPNRIRVKATDSRGQVVTKDITVHGTIKRTRRKAEEEDQIPLVQIDSPKDGERTKREIIVIRGRTKPGAKVTINDNRVLVEEDGSFVAAVRLEFGPNKIIAKATDLENRVVTDSITVYFGK